MIVPDDAFEFQSPIVMGKYGRICLDLAREDFHSLWFRTSEARDHYHVHLSHRENVINADRFMRIRTDDPDSKIPTPNGDLGLAGAHATQHGDPQMVVALRAGVRRQMDADLRAPEVAVVDGGLGALAVVPAGWASRPDVRHLLATGGTAAGIAPATDLSRRRD